MLKVITLASPTWDEHDSYGRLSHEMRNALIKQGVTVNSIGAKAPDSRLHLTPFNIVMGYPTHFYMFGTWVNSGVNIAFTMFESTKLPDGWVDVLNQCKAVCVPCNWNVEVFKENGVTVPIIKTPLGISDTFTYQPRVKGDKFRFICFKDRGYRKGYLKAVKAFVRAFGKRDDVELVIKARDNQPQTGIHTLANKNFRYIYQDMTDAELNELYHTCDVMLAPNAAEGFGFLPREFAKTGGISLATDYGGTADDLYEWGLPIRYTDLVPAWQDVDHMKGLGEWADVDVDDLAQKMLNVYQMSVDTRNKLGEYYSKRVCELYSWDTCTTQTLQALEQVVTNGNANTTG